MEAQDMKSDLKKALDALTTSLEVIDSKNKLLEVLTAIAEQAIKELEAAEFKLKTLQGANN